MTEKERFNAWLTESDLPNHAGMWEAWQAARRWISVSECLPEDDRLKLVWTRYGYEFAFYKKGEWHIKWFDERIGWRNMSITVTHWPFYAKPC